MSLIHVILDIPPEIQAGIDAGKYIRYDGVVRDLAGRMVVFLKEAPDISKHVNYATEAMAAAAKSTETGKMVLGFAKSNKYVFIGGAVIATVAIGCSIAHFVKKNKKLKEETIDSIKQCELDFTNSLLAYVEAIRKSEVTEESIDKVLASLKKIEDYRDKGVLNDEFSYENAELVFQIIKGYTEELMKKDDLDMTSDIPLKNDKIIDLQTYLNMQKKVLATG